LCRAQSQEKSAKVDLSRFSSDDLRACFGNAKICGTSDIYAISDELARRLPKLPTQQLVACFGDWNICGAGDSLASGWQISDELARRGDPGQLLARYWNEPNPYVRDGIEHVAYHFQSSEVHLFMDRVLAKRLDDGEDLYWPVNYLAEMGDPTALKELSSGRYRGQGCMQYSASVALFGKWKYRPAIPYLVGTAMYDPCLNVVDAALKSLDEIYPDAPEHIGTLEDIQRYFCDRARRDGFHMECDAE
jgi:hypothetical protein